MKLKRGSKRAGVKLRAGLKARPPYSGTFRVNRFLAGFIAAALIAGKVLLAILAGRPVDFRVISGKGQFEDRYNTGPELTVRSLKRAAG